MAATALRLARSSLPTGSVPLAIGVAVSIGLLFAFAPARHGAKHGGDLALSAPLPETVPPGVVLRVGDPVNDWIFHHNGWDKALPFTIQWAEISGGPDVTEAFHAGALDLGTGANVPPIHADWSGIPVRIIGFRQYPANAAERAWTFGLSPQSKIRTIADLKGKRIAFSPSQVQGQVVLETLRAAHIALKDVTLVELPSNMGGDVYTSALASGEVDAAPLASGLVSEHYIRKFGDHGARLLPHPAFRDDGAVIYVPEAVLADRGKAAALRLYARYWGYAAAWASTHREELARGYYAQARGLPLRDALIQAHATYPVEIPANWSGAIAFQQEAIDILAPGTGRPVFPAATLFDRRFETIAADAARKGLP